MKRLALTMFTVALIGWVTPVQAAPITYTETVIGSGYLDPDIGSFTDRLVTITVYGDTSTLTSTDPGFVLDDCGRATVSVVVATEWTFVNPLCAFVENGPAVAGIVGSVDPFLLGTGNTAFATYDLTSSIGPISGPSSLFQFSSSYPLSVFLQIGPGLRLYENFDLGSISDTSTFTATTSPATVPEPASLLLLGTGLLATVSRFRRRRSTSNISQ